MVLALFSSCCCCCSCYTFCSRSTSQIGKHHGSKGGKSFKIVPRKYLTQLLKPIEKNDFSSFFLLLLLLLHRPFRVSRIGNHYGSEGRNNRKILSRKCLTELRKSREKNDVGSFFRLLLLLLLHGLGNYHGSKGQRR